MPKTHASPALLPSVQKAQRLLEGNKIKTVVGASSFLVPSQSTSGRIYPVIIDAHGQGHCGCEAGRVRKMCGHVLACMHIVGIHEIPGRRET